MRIWFPRTPSTAALRCAPVAACAGGRSAVESAGGPLEQATRGSWARTFLPNLSGEPNETEANDRAGRQAGANYHRGPRQVGVNCHHMNRCKPPGSPTNPRDILGHPSRGVPKPPKSRFDRVYRRNHAYRGPRQEVPGSSTSDTGVPDKYYRGSRQEVPGSPTSDTGAPDKYYRGPRQVVVEKPLQKQHFRVEIWSRL